MVVCNKTIDVAVGIILNAHNEVCVTLRADHVDHAGLAEFPGGKVEVGESIEAALMRELLEEVGIHISHPELFITIPYQYAKYHVTLHVYLVREFQGKPHGMEGQPCSWVPIKELSNLSFPAANQKIIERLVELN